MNCRTQIIDEHTWLIEEYDAVNSVYMFLLEGEKEALLIDTGFGTIPLKEIVEELTKKPCFVINTHSHFDHIGGDYQFEKVMMHVADQRIYKEHCELLHEMFEECKDAPVKEDITWFAEEFEMNLGNRTVKIVHVPGHSQGCICILDKEARRIFTGDTCCKADVLLAFEGSTSVATYQKSIKKLIDMENEFDITWPSHHTKPVSNDILDLFYEASELLISGKESGDLESSPFGDCMKFNYKDIGIAYSRIQ